MFFITYYITSYVRNYSLRNNVVDIPNERSSHLVPTPTGGGLAISLSILLSIFILSGLSGDTVSLSIVLSSGVFLIGLTGWFDIHKEVPVLIRAVLYLVTSIWAVWFLGGVKSFSVGGIAIKSFWVVNFISVFWIAWLVNLYNFMDGIDGMLTSESMLITFSAALIILFVHGGGENTVLLFLLGIVCLGFLLFNFPPA